MAKTSSEKLTGNFLADTDGRIKAVLSDSSGTLQGNTVDTELPAAAALQDNLSDSVVTPTVGAALLVRDGNSAVFRRVQTAPVDGIASTYALLVAAGVNKGDGTLDRQRTPTTFKSFASTAITAGTGATVWTPAAGKKFRLMGFAISTSVAGVIILGDNAAATVIARSPALAAAGFFQLGAADMGNGILSAAANNVLKVDGPTGNVAGMVWGTEE